MDDLPPPTDEDDDVLEDARSLFQRCQTWESQARINMADDRRFAEADNVNMYQWNHAMVASREIDRKPTLTINMVREKCLLLINDARQNKPGIEIRAIGDGATYEAAKVFEGVCRHIELVSNAQAAYDTASDWQIKAGIGYWRVLTRYVTNEPSADAFNQEIHIQRIPDPNTVYLDPSIQQYDGSDANFGFVFRDWPRKDYEKLHPELADDLASTTLDASHGWLTEDMVREAEFYRKAEKTEWLVVRADGTVAREKDLAPEELAMLKVAKAQRRKVVKPEIEWFKIMGRKVIDKKIWPGAYIPIVRVVGEETVIDGQLDRKGHVRSQRDAQQYYNYVASAAAEYISGQTKTPWSGPAAAFEGYETYYENANTTTVAFLPYNQYDADGREIERPTRIDPPQSAQAYLQAMQIAEQQLMKVTGQYEANMGAPSNETSGVAIQQRQRKGDTATYQYIDHLGMAIRFTGRILIDLIPKVYDTARVVQILGKDGSQQSVQLDPAHPDAHQQVQDEEDDDYDPKSIAAIFNPNVGRYEVEADIGPSYATKRQDEFAALTQIMSQNQEAMKLGGDLLFRSADFPGADQLAERWRRSIDPHLLGSDGPPPAVMQLQQQLTALKSEAEHRLVILQQKLTETQQKLDDKTADLDRKTYEAETSRLQVTGAIDPDALKLLVREMVSQMIGMPAVPVMAAHAAAEQAMLPPDPSQMPPASGPQTGQPPA